MRYIYYVFYEWTGGKKLFFFTTSDIFSSSINSSVCQSDTSLTSPAVVQFACVTENGIILMKMFGQETKRLGLLVQTCEWTENTSSEASIKGVAARFHVEISAARMQPFSA